MQDHTTIGNAELLQQSHGYEHGAWIGRERAAIVTFFCSITRCLRLVSPENLVKDLRGFRVSVSSRVLAVSYIKAVTRLANTPFFLKFFHYSEYYSLFWNFFNEMQKAK